MRLWTRSILFSAIGAVLLAGGAAAENTRKSFPDVPQSHWASDAIQQLADRDLLRGYPDGTYGGKRAVTRYEAALAIDRLYQDALRNMSNLQVHPHSSPAGPRGIQGPPGLPGPAGLPGPTGEPGAGFNELPELFREQGRLRQDFSATQELFAGLRDQIRQIRSNLQSIGEQNGSLTGDVTRVEKKARRAPLTPPKAPLGQ